MKKIKTFFKRLDKDTKIMVLLESAEIILMILGWLISDAIICSCLVLGQLIILIPMFILTLKAYKECQRINKQIEKIFEDNEKDIK